MIHTQIHTDSRDLYPISPQSIWEVLTVAWGIYRHPSTLLMVMMDDQEQAVRVFGWARRVEVTPMLALHEAWLVARDPGRWGLLVRVAGEPLDLKAQTAKGR